MGRPSHRYVGANVGRREDIRLLTGAGRFVGDLHLPGALHLAFVRSPSAHGRILGVDAAAALAMPGVVRVVDGATLAQALPHLDGMQVSAPPGWSQRVAHRVSLPSQSILADGVVRFVGEPVAAVVAEDVPRALDAAERVAVRIDELPVVMDPLEAMTAACTRVHDSLTSNELAWMQTGKGDATKALAQAPRCLRRRIVHHRYAAMPMECRAVAAEYDTRTGVLTVYSATQVVHWLRDQLARSLNLTESEIRVVAPDVGGGFGVKGHVYPEELLVAYLAMRLGRPVRWVEQRQEHALASTHSRDQVHDVEVGFDGTGRILAIRDRCWIDSGAYCPVGAGVAYNTPAHLLGPYDIAHFESETTVVATNKAPSAPYRGAGRPEAVQVMERVLDLVAAELDLEPADVRFRNLVRPEQMPYAVGLTYRDGAPIVYDSGDYPKALAHALDELGGVAAFRARQAEARRAGRYLGIGMGCYTEGTGVGPFEGARVRIDPTGKVIVALGACPQGQGHETVFAQVVAESWQVAMEDVVVRLADTGELGTGYGTVGSRSTVTAAMAAEQASTVLKDKVLAIAGELLEASSADLELSDGGVQVRGAPDLRVSLADVARAARPGWQHARPPGVEAGLDATAYYEPPTVTWSYAANAAIVEVLLETGEVRVERYVEVHDAGTLVNPRLADGQVMGGIVQGLGGALREAIVYDDSGQLLTASFLDYAMPRASDFPAITVIHHQTPSPLNPLGVKGLGEGGAIAPPVVIANAIGDALKPWRREFNRLPIRAEDLVNGTGLRGNGT